MRQKTFIGILLSMALAACGSQAPSTLPTSAPVVTEAPVMIEPPSLTATPAEQAVAPTQAGASGGETNGSGYDDDYDYSSPSGGDLPVTGGNAVKSQEGPLGPMLVDANGMTLYVFLKDSQNANTSACSAVCADNWPALTTATAGDGVDASLLGSFQHEDGTTQFTYNGWPLYYFVQDRNPGEINGQGASGNWYILSPSGEIIK